MKKAEKELYINWYLWRFSL